MLWFNFILGSNFISFVSNSLSSNYHKQNKGNKIWTKDKIEPQQIHCSDDLSPNSPPFSIKLEKQPFDVVVVQWTNQKLTRLQFSTYTVSLFCSLTALFIMLRRGLPKLSLDWKARLRIVPDFGEWLCDWKIARAPNSRKTREFLIFGAPLASRFPAIRRARERNERLLAVCLKPAAKILPRSDFQEKGSSYTWRISDMVGASLYQGRQPSQLKKRQWVYWISLLLSL